MSNYVPNFTVTKSGQGLNIYHYEIENILTSHRQIFEAAIIGKPGDKSGELVSAYIVNKA